MRVDTDGPEEMSDGERTKHARLAQGVDKASREDLTEVNRAE